jgi:hypothetical protein
MFPKHGTDFCVMHELTDAVCIGQNRNGQPCGRKPIQGDDRCYTHGGVRPSVETDEPALPDLHLPPGQRQAVLHRIVTEHWTASPDCAEAAILVEQCGHGGTLRVCWGCRTAIAGIGRGEDPCLEAFRIRAADPGAGVLLCSAVLP